MSKAADIRRKREGRNRLRMAWHRWRVALAKAREHFTAKLEAKNAAAGGSRFLVGTDREKHLRGYWKQIEAIARHRFHASKPRRPLP